jgi:hypothetical protein
LLPLLGDPLVLGLLVFFSDFSFALPPSDSDLLVMLFFLVVLVHLGLFVVPNDGFRVSLVLFICSCPCCDVIEFFLIFCYLLVV